MESERIVNPACPNAGNPFHQCADYCAGGGGRRIATTGGKRPVVNGEGGRVEGRVVDPNCVNAANPFHQCAEYCTKKAADARKQTGSGRFAFPVLSKLSPRSLGDRSDGSKSVQNRGLIKEAVRKMEEGRKVDPKCVNASNPFHQCTEHCSPRTSGARRQTVERTLEIMSVSPQILHQEC